MIDHGWNGVPYFQTRIRWARSMCDLRSNAELHKLLLLAYGRQLEAQNSGLYGILPRIITHGNGKSPLNGHLSGNIICEYMFCCFFFPLQCLMNYQGIQFAISPSGGGFACSNVFHPTIPLNGCIYILVILP